MNELTIERIAGVDAGLPHLLAALMSGQYSKSELHAYRLWWNEMIQSVPTNRAMILAAWAKYLPGRSEDDLMRLATAGWEDGFTGTTNALILGRGAE